MKNPIYIFNILLSFIPLILLGQTHKAALEMSEHNILYRGYPNRIHVLVTNTEGKEVVLTGKELQVSKIDSTTFIVKPEGRNRQLTVNISVVDNGDTLIVRNVDYRIMNLPTPMLYWGPNKEGTNANIKEKKLFIKYPPEIPLDASFTILEWVISIDASFNTPAITGKGSNISEAKSLLEKVNHPSHVSIAITYIGPDGVHRKLSAFWEVAPWEDSKEPIDLLIID